MFGENIIQWQDSMGESFILVTILVQQGWIGFILVEVRIIVLKNLLFPQMVLWTIICVHLN